MLFLLFCFSVLNYYTKDNSAVFSSLVFARPDCGANQKEENTDCIVCIAMCVLLIIF